MVLIFVFIARNQLHYLNNTNVLVSHLYPQMIMEIPLELMLTIRKKLPWMFFPDIVPVGHPIFDIINSTNPEVIVPFLLSEKMLITN